MGLFRKSDVIKTHTLLIYIVLITSLMVLLCGCNSSESVSEEPTEEETKVEESHYTVNQTEMGNYMCSGQTLIKDGWIYTFGVDPNSGIGGLVKMRIDGTEPVVIFENAVPYYTTVSGEYVYSVMQSEDGKNNLYRARLGGEDSTKLLSNVTYFRIVDGHLYYCKVDSENQEQTKSFCRANLDGKEEEVILDKEIYCPYIVGDELFYQDDNDGETLHKYDVSSKEDIKITDEATYEYVLIDDSLYCIQGEDSMRGQIVRVDLSTLRKDLIFDGAGTGPLIPVGDLIVFQNANDNYRLYSTDKNGDNINLITQDDYVTDVQVFEDKLVYWDCNSEFSVDNKYICDIDGSNKKELLYVYLQQ